MGFFLSEKESRPESVILFERLQYVAVFIRICIMALFLPLDYPLEVGEGPGALWVTFIVIALNVPLQIGMIFLVTRWRQNWARWIALVFFILSLPGTFDLNDSLLEKVGETFYWIMGLLGFAHAILQGFSFFKIFSGEANEWFRKDEPTVPK